MSVFTYNVYDFERALKYLNFKSNFFIYLNINKVCFERFRYKNTFYESAKDFGFIKFKGLNFQTCDKI